MSACKSFTGISVPTLAFFDVGLHDANNDHHHHDDDGNEDVSISKTQL
jgi:hypothetical protein